MFLIAEKKWSSKIALFERTNRIPINMYEVSLQFYGSIRRPYRPFHFFSGILEHLDAEAVRGQNPCSIHLVCSTIQF